jgi:hypothetical protein
MRNGSLNAKRNTLSLSQRNRLLVTCKHIDRLLGDVEATLNTAVSNSVFPNYIEDVSSFQRKAIEAQIANLRGKLLQVLDSQSIAPEQPQISATHSIRVGLTFVDIAITELAPRHMRGYGVVSDEGAEDLLEIVASLQSGVREMQKQLSGDRTEKGSKAC